MKFSGLQARLLVVLGIFLLLLAGIFGWESKRMYGGAWKRQAQALQLEANQGARLLDYWLAERTRALQAVAAVPWGVGEPPVDRLHLLRAERALPDAVAVELRGRDGALVMYGGHAMVASPRFLRWIRHVQDGDLPTVANLVTRQGDQILCVYPIRAAGGSRGGILLAYFEARDLAGPFTDLPVENRLVAVLDSHHQYVYASRSELAVGAIANPSVRRFLADRSPPRIFRWAGNSWLVAQDPSQLSGLDVLVGEPVDEAFSQVRDTIAHLWGVFGAICVMVGILGLWVDRAIVRPVTRITRTAKQVAAGDLEARAGPTGAGEGGDLATAFDEMTQQLGQSVRNREIFWQNAPMAVLRVDAKGLLVESNPSGRAALERLAPCVLDRQCAITTLGPLKRAIDEAAQLNGAWSGRLQIGEGDAESFWECLIYPVSPGHVPFVMVIQLLEVTEQVKRQRILEKEVENKTADLLAALVELKALDRAKTEFLSLISHELRTPLNIITGYAGMLSEGAFEELTPDGKGAIGHILGAGERLQALVNDLLDVARLEAGALELRTESLDYLALLRDVLYERSNRAESQGITIETSLTEPLPPVLGDPHRTAQVLENLISNAVKFSMRGDRVTIRIFPAGANVVTEVVDTGPGIPEDAIPKLFSRFFQVDMSATRLHGGTGLGLTIVKGLVEAMGGQVGCRSKPSQGSVFWFTLPSAGEVAAGVECRKPGEEPVG